MNMMPLGFHNGGGRTPSSSNLSPLAPPFTLVKSYQKQQNSNPPVDYTTQSYGHRLDHSSPAWTPPTSSPFGPNFTDKSSGDGNFAPMDVHGFPGSQPNNSSSSTGSIPLNSATTNGFDGFPYGKYPHSVPTPLVETESHYPSHVASDHNLLSRVDPGYDLMFNYRSDKLSGSSQVDDGRNGSGVEYTPQWNGLWSGLNDVEQGNWLDLGGGFGSKEYKPSGSSTGQKYMKKGLDAGGDHFDYHAGTLPNGSKGPYAETSIRSKKCFEGFGGENNFGSLSIGKGKSYKEPNPGATTACFTRVSSAGAYDDDFNLQDPFLQASLPKHSRVYERLADVSVRCANYTDSHGFDSTSSMGSSHGNMTKMTFGGFPSPGGALPTMTANASSNEPADKLEKSFDFPPYHPFSLNCQTNSYTGLADGLFARSSSIQMEDNLNKVGNDGCLDQLLKIKSVSPIRRHSSAADRLPDMVSTLYSMEKPSDGPEIQNPGEDSPCWKGSPAANFTPFGGPKLVIPDVVLEKVESRANLKNEEHKSNPIRLDTADIIYGPGELDENNSAKRSFDANYVSKECDGSHLTKRRSNSIKLNDEEGFQLPNKNHEPNFGTGNDFSLFNYPSVSPSSRSFQCLQINSEGNRVVPEEKLESVVESTVAQVKTNCPDVSSSCEVSGTPSSAGGPQPHSPFENEATSKDGQLTGKDSNSVTHISVLVNAMTNLSELLMCHCSDNHARPTELDYTALKQIICNLNSCLVKEAEEATQTDKAQDSQQADTARKATNAKRYRPVIETLDDLKCENLYSRKERTSDCYVVEDGAETDANAETILAIKRALDEDLPSEEMQPETLMYRDLWLEAEASLCATTVRARALRTKLETDKRKYRQSYEEGGVPISKASDESRPPEPPRKATDSLSSSKHAHMIDMESAIMTRICTLSSAVEDLKSTDPLELREEGQKKPPLDTEDHHLPACHTEASVMDRFQILKSREDNANSMNAEDRKLPSMENFASPSPDHLIKDSYFSSTDDPEASVMARFSILKSRVEHSEPLDSDLQLLDGPGFFPTEGRSSVGVQPEAGKDMARLVATFSSEPGKTLLENVIKTGEELFEGWYDCSEPGWEHVVKEGWPKHK